MAIKDFVTSLVNRLTSYLQSRAVQPTSLPQKLPTLPVSTSDGLATSSPSLDNTVKVYSPSPTNMPPKIVLLAKAINLYEGNGPKDRATRNNNPGNCRYSSVGYLAKYGKVGKDKDGFAIFASPALGWLYLENLLLNWAKTSRKDWTILELMKSYAPSADNNDPVAYARFLRSRLGVDATTKLSELLK